MAISDALLSHCFLLEDISPEIGGVALDDIWTFVSCCVNMNPLLTGSNQLHVLVFF